MCVLLFCSVYFRDRLYNLRIEKLNRSSTLQVWAYCNIFFGCLLIWSHFEFTSFSQFFFYLLFLPFCFLSISFVLLYCSLLVVFRFNDDDYIRWLFWHFIFVVAGCCKQFVVLYYIFVWICACMQLNVNALLYKQLNQLRKKKTHALTNLENANGGKMYICSEIK